MARAEAVYSVASALATVSYSYLPMSGHFKLITAVINNKNNRGPKLQLNQCANVGLTARKVTAISVNVHGYQN